MPFTRTLDFLDTGLLAHKAVSWFFAHVWTHNILLQGILIGLAAFVAWTLHRIVAKPALDAIHHLHIAPRFKRVLTNMRRQIFPFAWLALLLIAQLGAPVEMPLDLTNALMNLLMAWIVIRLATQFIDNGFVRNLFASAIWIIAALQIIGLLPAAQAELDHFAISFGVHRISALSVVKGAFALCVLLYGTTFISSVIERRIHVSRHLAPSSKVLISKSLRAILVTISLLIAVTSSGIDLSLLAALSGGIGIGVGFGLQKVVSNILSGMLLLLDRSIKPGDIIEMPNGSYGWVEKMGARYTEIITRENKSHLIPNENFITQEFINWSHGNTIVRLDVTFGVHYASDPHRIRVLAQEAAQKAARVLPEPAPICHLTEFGDSALNFKLFFWVRDAENGIINVRGDVMLALWDIFKANGIEIPYPQRVVHMQEAGAKPASL